MENGEWRRKSCDYNLLLAQRESFKNAIITLHSPLSAIRYIKGTTSCTPHSGRHCRFDLALPS